VKEKFFKKCVIESKLNLRTNRWRGWKPSSGFRDYVGGI